MQEPTTGLDAHAAGVVLRAVQRTCHTDRRTVVCTIHQPSMTHFQACRCHYLNFSALLLLMQNIGFVAHRRPMDQRFA